MATLCYFLYFTIQGAMALQCLTCMYDIEESKDGWIGSILDDAMNSVFSNMDCPYATGVQDGVKMERCREYPAPPPGETLRCGDIDVKYQTAISHTSRHLHIRGCLIVDSRLNGNCYREKYYTRKHRGFIQSKAVHTADGSGFNGQICINTPEEPAAWQYYNSSESISKTTYMIVFCCVIFKFVKDKVI